MRWCLVLGAAWWCVVVVHCGACAVWRLGSVAGGGSAAQEACGRQLTSCLRGCLPL